MIDAYALELRELTKTFERMDRPVLDDVNELIREGEFVSLIGPSGCGKTTLLRIVAGLLNATSGEVIVWGQPSRGPSRDKAMVFQHFNLFPWRTVLDNAAYGLELHGVPRAERRERAQRYLELLDLVGFAKHYPHEISGGMKQRVGLARALAIEPKILLMDEPFGALDALTRDYLQDELSKICESSGQSVLFVTHSIDEAVYLSDRIIVMAAHPTRFLRTFDVDLPRPRSGSNVRAAPQFAELRGEVWELLRGELGRRGSLQ